MRYLILSDIHSNFEALQAAVAAAKDAYDRVICCGDIVGYCADPNPVVDWVREHADLVVRGNHDKVCAGIVEPSDFSDNARFAAYWTRRQLRPDNQQYLITLPRGPLEVDGQFAILHGSPRDEDEYIPAPWAAARIFGHLKHRISFFGHTHLQGGFIRRRNRIAEVRLKPAAKDPRTKRPTWNQPTRGILEIHADETYYLNPGSVGQPRDRDPRAAFAIYNTEGVVEYRRTPYGIETAMDKILRARLPEMLAYRLAVGR